MIIVVRMVYRNDSLSRIGCRQETIFINEGNLWRLIIKSKKSEEEKFERLAMEEILPAIRKTGSYSGAKKQIAGNPANTPKCYDYTRQLLEQPHFTAPIRPYRLSISMFGH